MSTTLWTAFVSRTGASPVPTFRAGIALGPRAALVVAACLAILFLLVRGYAMLGPQAIRPLFLLHCVLMALTPWLLFGRCSRAQMGLQKPRGGKPWLLPMACGVLASCLCFAIGYALFRATHDNWMVSVGRSYFDGRPPDLSSLPMLYLMFTIPAMIFSPIGEEIFFRGYLQRMLETRWSKRASTAIEASWFAVAHLIHHGLFLTAVGIGFRALSGTMWFVLMFALSCTFAWLRQRYDSIIPAIVAHSAFNWTMNSLIFMFLWRGFI